MKLAQFSIGARKVLFCGFVAFSLACYSQTISDASFSLGQIVQHGQRPGLRDIPSSNLMFEPNRGQGPSGVDYLARANGLAILLHPTYFSLSTLPGTRAGSSNVSTPLRVQFVGALASATPDASLPLPTRINDFRGKDPAAWHLNIPTYGKVQYSSIYDGVDVIYHGTGRHLEYDFRIAAGVDPKIIRLSFEGAANLTVNADGDLIVGAPGATAVVQRK